MMYPFMTLSDNTEVVHSEAYDVNGVETVKVYFERPIKADFQSAECYLPTYEWKNIDGFTDDEILPILEARSDEIIKKWISYFGKIYFYC